MKIIFLMTLLIVSCGQQKVEPVPQPLPQPTPTSTATPVPGEKISYQEMQGYLVTYCQSCHATAQFMSGEAGLKASQVKNRLWARQMPPSSSPKALPDNVRTLMVGYF